MDKYIIAISGKRCSGKTTLSEEIKSINIKNNINTKIIHIADKLKENFCKDMKYNLDKMMNDRNYKDTYRAELIAYDLVYKSKNGETCWIYDVVQQIYEDTTQQVFIIPDLRRQYEYRFLENAFNNIQFVRIKVPDSIRISRGWVLSEVDNHISETDLDDYPHQTILLHPINGQKIKI